MSGVPALTLRRALAATALALLLAFPIVRVSVADRTPLRRVAVHGLWFEKTEVDPGQTVTRQLSWTPEQDVYIVGWNPLLLAPPEASYVVELTLSEAQTRLFVMGAGGSRPADAGAWNPAELPAGTGYHVRAGRTLTLRFRIANQGDGELRSEAAGAQIRYLQEG
jgi:hypothetical protein